MSSGVSMKVCAKCDALKPLHEFYPAGQKRQHSWCKNCMRESAKMSARKAAKDPVKREKRDSRLRELLLSKYGLTTEHYELLLEMQGGRCGICGTTSTGTKGSFCVDHDHDSGRVRGLLCDRCNRGIGLLGDNPDTLRSAARYLDRHERTAEEPICRISE